MFIIFSFIFILLVYVSTYFTFVGHCIARSLLKEGKTCLLRTIIVRGVPTLYFSSQITFIVLLHVVVIKNSHLLLCMFLFFGFF